MKGKNCVVQCNSQSAAAAASATATLSESSAAPTVENFAPKPKPKVSTALLQRFCRRLTCAERALGAAEVGRERAALRLAALDRAVEAVAAARLGRRILNARAL